MQLQCPAAVIAVAAAGIFALEALHWLAHAVARRVVELIAGEREPANKEKEN